MHKIDQAYLHTHIFFYCIITAWFAAYCVYWQQTMMLEIAPSYGQFMLRLLKMGQACDRVGKYVFGAKYDTAIDTENYCVSILYNLESKIYEEFFFILD